MNSLEENSWMVKKTENPAQSMDKLLELISKLSKSSGSRVNAQKSIIYLKSNNK